jgi:hypothetical protein
VRLPGIRKACTAPSPPLRKPARGGWVYLGVVLATPFVLCGAASVHRAMHALFGAPVQWNVRNTAETLHFIELPTNRSCPSYGRATARCA